MSKYEDERLSPRFWSKTRLASTEANACWIWTGTYDQNGTPKFNVGKENLLPARLAYKELVGPLTNKDHLRRTCKNRSCINPDHGDKILPTTRNQWNGSKVAPRPVHYTLETCVHCFETVGCLKDHFYDQTVVAGDWGCWVEYGWEKHRHQPGEVGRRVVFEMATANGKGRD